MHLSWTFSRYLGLQFLIGIMIVFGGCLVLIFLVDLVELMRRAASHGDVALRMLITMALFKLPNVAENALPFAVLFGSIWTFVRLTRSNELVIARASGVSVWEFMAPAVVLVLFIGAFMITVYNPLSSTLVGKFEQLENRYLRGATSMIAIKSTGFWLRQGTGDTQAVIHADKVINAQKTLDLEGVTVQLYRNQDSYYGLLEAKTSVLASHMWHFTDATLTLRNGTPQHFDSYDLPTDLSAEQVRESFASPQTISFWQLPRFIALAKAAGFSALPHRLHWHAVLATPILLCAMVLVAATFSLRITRLGGVPQLAAAGIVTGFLLYFLSDVANTLGTSGIIPIPLAAWSPSLVALSLGLAMLFHLEDG